MRTRETLVFVVLLFAVYVLVRTVTGCHALTPAEQAKVAADGVKLSMCATQAHLCKVASGDAGVSACWDEYEACMVAHGYRDGGK